MLYLSVSFYLLLIIQYINESFTQSYEMDVSALCKEDRGIRKRETEVESGQAQMNRSLWVWTEDRSQHNPALRSPVWRRACRSLHLNHGAYLTQIQNELQHLHFGNFLLVSIIPHCDQCSQYFEFFNSNLDHIPFSCLSSYFQHSYPMFSMHLPQTDLP